MTRIHRLVLEPPVINSSSFWASSYAQLEELYACGTGGVTTRTATLSGFPEDPALHQHALLQKDHGTSSINSYGYSPHPLSQYLTWIRTFITSTTQKSQKPFIISIAPASVEELSSMLDAIQELRLEIDDCAPNGNSRIGIELNTSCPNISGHPPPAYNPPSLTPLFHVFQDHFQQDPTLTIGLKLAPYVHAGQFFQIIELITTLSTGSEPEDKTNCISFLTCTNTLGSSVVFLNQTTMDNSTINEDVNKYAVPTVIGGLAGKPIHALSLGNVYSFRKLLSEHPDPSLRRISIIGVGGVTSREAAARMFSVGASVVACATALGVHGIGIFEELVRGV